MSDAYSLDRAPIVVEQPRNVLIVCAVCAVGLDLALAWWLGVHPGRVGGIEGHLWVSFFALIAAVAVATAIRPGRMTIAQEGLTYRGPFYSVSWSWRDFAAIRIVQAGGFSGVGFDFARPLTLTQGFAKRLGAPGYFGLPTGWPISPPEIVQLLNNAKRCWA